MTLHKWGLLGAILIAVACLVSAATSQAALWDNEVLNSPMNNLTAPVTASYWQDVSGNNYDAMANPPTYDGTLDTGGTNRGTAVDFVTTITPETQFNSQQITFADGMNTNLDPGTTDFSFSFWYNQTEADAGLEGVTRHLLKKGNMTAAAGGFSVFTDGGALTLRAGDVSGDPLGLFSLQHVGGLPGLETPVNLVGTGWHLVTGVFDRTGTYRTADSVTLYVDGTPVNTGTLPQVNSLPINIASTTGQARIAGNNGSDTTRDFEGYMDDVAFYRGALSDSDVQTLYAATSFDASTVTNPNVTPVFVHNFVTNANVAPNAATVPDVYGEPVLSGTIQGDVTQVTDATRGEVLSVNTLSNNNYVDFGDNLDPMATSYTVSVWVKRDGANATSQQFATKGNRSSEREGWSLGFTAAGLLYARANYDGASTGTTRLYTRTETAVTADEWHHVALVIDQTTGLFQGYLDGVESGLDGDNGLWNCDEVNYGVTFPTDGSAEFDTTEGLRLGRAANTLAVYPFQGDLDDFAIWNRALTSAEILAIYGGADLLPPPVVITVPGDTDGDDDVDSLDAGTLASNWGGSVTNGALSGDFNADNVVNALDASILAANWTGALESAEPVGVPEPSMLVLMSVAGVLFTLRRRIV
ncbi:MAG TPA: LamG-like jellyroll fold domain-containing protein [Thermoguttaceae bacterium]|nr:LamG-like jellyroll fold domain-containing protein [Thermoguttaceae bacterium]